jgi:hypothetical protein
MNYLLLVILLLFLGGCQSIMNDLNTARKSRIQALIERQLQAKNFPGIQYLMLNADSVIFEYAGG